MHNTFSLEQYTFLYKIIIHMEFLQEDLVSKHDSYFLK